MFGGVSWAKEQQVACVGLCKEPEKARLMCQRGNDLGPEFE